MKVQKGKMSEKDKLLTYKVDELKKKLGMEIKPGRYKIADLINIVFRREDREASLRALKVYLNENRGEERKTFLLRYK